MRLEIVSPEGIAWQSDNVSSVTLPLVGGQVQILSGHIPLIAMLDIGNLTVCYDGKVEDLAVDKGYVNVNNDLISVLTEQAINLEDVDLSKVEDAKRAAEKALENAAKNNISPEEIERLESIVKISLAQMIKKKK